MSAGSGRSRDNGFNCSQSQREGGNIFWALWRACGVKEGRRRYFGMPSRSLSKGKAQLVYSRGLVRGTERTGLCRDYSSGRSMPTATLRRCHTRRTVLHRRRQFNTCLHRALSRRAATMRPRWMRTAISTRRVHFQTRVQWTGIPRFPLISILRAGAFP